MGKNEDQDVQADRAQFMENRQKKIDAKNQKEKTEERTSYGSGFNQPDAVRATDGGEPGTPEKHPLKKAEELEKDSDKIDDHPDASDAVEKFAAENKVDLSTVKGSGKDGKITKADVQKVIADRDKK